MTLPTAKQYVEGEKITLAIPADALELCDPEDGLFTGVLDSVVWKGSYYEMIVNSPSRRWLIKSQMDEQMGAEVAFRIVPGILEL